MGRASTSALTESESRGLFGPGTMVWAVDRELAVLLGSGQRALLMQVAHPLVAQAVADHSRYAVDPMGRLRHTLEAIYTFAYGSRTEALAAVERVNRRHRPVRGKLRQPVGTYPIDTGYSALDSRLLLWVYATLIDSSLLAYASLVRRLTDSEGEQYYAEMMRVAHVWGITTSEVPATLRDLRAWMADMIASGEVAVSQEGRIVGRRIMASPAWWIPGPLFAPVSLFGAWLLPASLRMQFGFSWGPRREALMRTIARLSRATVPRLPHFARDVPWARVARRRVGTLTL